jgi:pseudouridine-5'-phosphate glycosidase
MEAEIRAGGCVPATCAVVQGELVVGLTEAELRSLAGMADPRKISARDLAAAIVAGDSGGLTVAATLSACAAAGIRVFATGGIGGVHRGWNRSLDISADLAALARAEVVTVCAGAKSILDLPATLEALDSLGVPVVGLGTRNFPRFSSPPDPALPLPASVDDAAALAEIARAHWSLGHRGGVLAVVPCPAEHAVDAEDFERWYEASDAAARSRRIRGAAVTPFLLSALAELSGGRTLRANVALLLANARAAAAIARKI